MGSRDRVIPNWVNRTDPSGQLRPDANNSLQRGSKPINVQAQTIAEDAVIPIVYGGPERIAGMPYTTGLASNGVDLLVSYILCEGEIESISSVELNNEPLPAGVIVAGYYGTQTQGIDPDLQAALGPTYNESHLGTAYIVARFPPGSVTSFPNLTAEIYGKRITDRTRKGVTLGSYATYITPANSAQNRIDGATLLDLSFIGALDSWTTASTTRTLISKYQPGAGNSSVIMHIGSDAFWDTYVSATGTGFTLVARCPLPIPLAPGQFGGVRLVLNLASGANRTQQHYYSTDGITWIPLGGLLTNSGALSVFDAGTTPWQIGGRSQGLETGGYTALGPIYGASVTVAGVERVRFNPEDAAVGAVSWPAPTGELWTIAGGPTVQARAAFASNNPATILDDFMRVYGRRAVNLASVKTSANFDDAAIGGAKRATLTITLTESRNVDDWIEVLRGYVPGWVIYKEAEWHIVPDAASAPVLAYDADADARTDGASPMVLVKRGTRDVPNVIEVKYTETSAKPWTDKPAVAELAGLGTGKRRKTTLSFPGIRSYAQAYRFAVERLNHFTLENIEGDIAVMDDGIRIVPGDIVTITDSAHGWAAKPVRVLAVSESDNGRWDLRFRIYNAGAYSTDAPAAPAVPDSGTLPNPIFVAPITGLVASESLRYESASINTSDGLARGLIWQSRVVANWTASPDAFFDAYEISIQSDSMPQPSVSTSRLAQFCSAPLVQGTTYTVRVRAINSLGFASAFASVAVAVNGKATPPGDVTVMDFAAEIGGECILKWRPVPDVDIVRYEWRALATSATTAPWDSMPVIDRPDTNYSRIKGLSPGPTLFAIKAIDSVGRYSDNPFYVSLTITSDASNFLQSFDMVPSPGQEAYITKHEWPLVEGDTSRPLPRWILLGNQTWNAAMPNPVASANTPVVSAFGQAGSPGISYPTWDWGTALEATVSLDLSWIRLLGGNYTILSLVVSLDNTNWTYPAYWVIVPTPLGKVTTKVTARFVRLVCYPQNAGVTWMQEGPITMQVSATTRHESGSASSSSSVATRCNLTQKYSKYVSITITPRGSTFATGSYDNVQVGLAIGQNYFDAWLFNATGDPVSQAFSWTFEGV